MSGLASLMLFGSCQDEDYGFSSEQIKKSQFAKNFEDEYGAIDPDQSWDLTHYMTRTSKYEDSMLDFLLGQEQGQTRAADANGVIYKNPESTDFGYYEGGYYVVEEQTIRWLRGFLKEGRNNTDLGTAFSMVAPDNKFAIIPIYQGFANMDWSLHMSVNGVDTKLWTESENILVRNSDTEDWSTVGTTYGTSQTIYSHQIKSKPILVDFSNSTVKDFSLYLHIDTGKDGFAKAGTNQSSSTGMMLALSCPIPTNVGNTNGTPNYAMVIGCEDSDLNESDWDMNDVCFLIIGYPYIPDRVSMTSKRYMCEDLGNTYDFDFNDIVVDVTEILREHYDPIANDFVPTTAGKKQFANIKHLCGTIPLQVTVGDYTFPWITKPTNHAQTLTELQSDNSDHPVIRPVAENNESGVNWEPNVIKEVTGWNTETNNIIVRVYTAEGDVNKDVFTDKFGEGLSVEEENADEHLYILNFPGRGESPLMLATDQTTPWKAEHEHIPVAWWQNGEHRPTVKDPESQNPGEGGGISGGNAEIPASLVKTDENGNAVIWEAPEGFEGMYSWKNSEMLQTTFLDAAFEGYTIFEVIVDGEKNKATSFYFRKVGNDWSQNVDDAEGDLEIENGKASYTFTKDILTNYPLGVAIANEKGMDKVFYPTKVIMKKPTFYALTIGSASHGTVTVNPGANSDGKYAEGTEVTLTAQPESGYHFVKWNEDGNTSRIRKYKVQSDATLTPVFDEGDPLHLWDNGEVYISDWKWESFPLDFGSKEPKVGDIIYIKTPYKADNINIKLGSTEYKNKIESQNWADNTTYFDIDNAGCSFILADQAMINALKENPTIEIQSNNVKVTYIDLKQNIKRTVAVEAGTNGSVSIEGQSANSAELADGVSVTIKATPAEHYKFVSWSKGGSVVENAGATYNFTLSEATAGTYTANFAEAAKVSITASSNNDSWGTVNTTGGEYYEGTSVTLTATATNEGVFVKWTKNGNDAGTEATLNLTVSTSSAGEYQAVFRAKESYSVTLAVGENGTATIDTQANAAEGKYYEGTEVTFTANPAVGYKVAHWKKNGVTIDGATKNTLTIKVSENATYSVEFEETKEATGETTLSASGNYYRFSAMSNISEQATKLTLTLTFVNSVNGVVGILDQNNNITSTVQFGYSTTSPLSIEVTNSALISAAKSGDLYMASYSNAGDISKIEYKAE